MDQSNDIVIAGHFDNIKNRDDQAFILVLTKFGNHWRRQYFLRPETPVVSLSYEDHPDAEMRKKGFRAFLVNFTIEPSDDFAFIFWDGNQYAVRSGFRHQW